MSDAYYFQEALGGVLDAARRYANFPLEDGNETQQRGNDLLRTHIRMLESSFYPFVADSGVTVLGPDVWVEDHGQVITRDGQKYYRDDRAKAMYGGPPPADHKHRHKHMDLTLRVDGDMARPAAAQSHAVMVAESNGYKVVDVVTVSAVHPTGERKAHWAVQLHVELNPEVDRSE